MSEMKIAVVGCGDWGKNLVRNHAALGSLAAIVDPREAVTGPLVEAHGAPARTFEDVLADPAIHGLVIATPGPTHCDLACAGFAAGKHVYVEKPMAMNDADAAKMRDAAIGAQREIMVGHLLQYHPVYERLKTAVQEGMIGTLQYVYSNRLNFGKVLSAEDSLWALAPHDVSMVLGLTGGEPTHVHAERMDVLQPGVADKATVYLHFANGLRAHIHVSWLNPVKEQRFVAIGSSGMLVFDDTLPWADKLALYPNRVTLGAGDPVMHRGDKQVIAVPEAEPLKMECQYFLDLMAGNVPSRTGADEAMRVLKVLTSASA